MSKNLKCLIVDEMHESVVGLLKEINVIPVYKPDISREEIIEQIVDFEILFIRSKTKVDRSLLAKASKLKIVGRAGAGIDNLDEVYLADKGIQIINAPEGNKDAVGEQTIAMLLSLMHNVVKSHLEVTRGKWDREGNRGVELSGKIVGIIGYGNMGKAVAQRLSSFGCTVLAYDKYLIDYQDQYCQAVSLQTIFNSADILSLHVPLIDETYGWVDDDFFNKFKKPIYFLNLSRGEIVVLPSLVNAIKCNEVKAAALDVLQNEKLNTLNKEQQECFDFLSSSSNVILTPHIGGWSHESYFKINQVLINKLYQLINT
jgi:D-3-phosphoglycerate dehydrogenase